MSLFIDIHTHSFARKDGVVKISNHVMGVAEAMHPANSWFSAGLHPWYYHQDNCEQLLLELKGMLDSKRLLAIGEAGLDKLKGESMELQEKVFCQQADWAYECKIPIIVHCVKAVNELLKIRKRYPKDACWIFHGFSGSAEVLNDCLKLGIVPSFGKGLFRNNSLLPSLLQKLEDNAYFLETDAMELEVEQVYEKAAEAKNSGIEEIKQAIFANFAQRFSRYGKHLEQ